MTNTGFDGIDDFNCVRTQRRIAQMREQGIPEQQILSTLAPQSRDNARTPMPWNASTHAGFSTVAPWFRVNPNYPRINVASQESDPDSILNFYRRLIRLRKQEPALIYGRYELIAETDRHIYAYTRTLGKQRLVVICNLSSHDALYSHLDFHLNHDQLLLANYPVRPHGKEFRLVLHPFEARIYRVSG